MLELTFDELGYFGDELVERGLAGRLSVEAHDWLGVAGAHVEPRVIGQGNGEAIHGVLLVTGKRGTNALECAGFVLNHKVGLGDGSKHGVVLADF